MKCWGDNRWGQLGKGDKVNRGDDADEMGDALTDINLGAGRTAVSLAANGGHTCAILDNASVKCWGLNTWGQIGRLMGNDTPLDPLVCAPGATTASATTRTRSALWRPPSRATLLDWPSVTATTACCWSNGQVKCWGSNEQGQVGHRRHHRRQVDHRRPPNEITALAVTALKPGTVVEELTAGGFHTCVWNTGGTLNCWGDNSTGQLGLNSIDTRGDDPDEMGAAHARHVSLGLE